jgi:integrase
MLSIRTYVFKRRLSTGEVSYRVRWKDPKSGRWLSISGGRTADEATIIEAQVREALLKGEDPAAGPDGPVDNRTVAQVIELFYGHSRFQSATERWQDEARKKIEKDILSKLGRVRFAELTPERVFKFYLTLKSRDLTHSTIEKYHQLLSILGDVYAEQSSELSNPVRKIRDFTKRFPKQPPSRDINFLTPPELDQLFKEAEHAKGPLLAAFARFLAYTGLRRTDLDEVSMMLHVRKAKRGRTRVIPLLPEALAAVIGLKGNGPHVFTRLDRSRYHPDSFLRPLQRAARRAGISKRIDIHTLRHSHGSNKIRMGWGLKKVSVLLGHADISTTAKIYTHLLDGDLKVRDDARLFDNANESPQSERAGDNGKVAQLIAQTITEALADTADGQRVLGDFVRSLRDVSAAVQAQDPATSGEKSRDIHKDSKNSSHAPLMLHASGKAGSINEKTPTPDSSLRVSLSRLGVGRVMEPTSGLEPLTYALRKRCSTD